MNKREAKQYTLKYITDIFISNGFTEKKKSSSDIEFVRKTVYGEDGMYLHYKDYNPIQVIDYYFYKRITAVNKVIKVIGDSIKLNPPINRETHSLVFNYVTLKQMKNQGGALVSTYLPQMQTEADVKVSVDMIIDFLEKDAIPLLDKFNDIREIDKVINGDDFWITDWQKPFNFGGNFYVKRLIVAKLAGGQKILEEVVEWTNLQKLNL